MTQSNKKYTTVTATVAVAVVTVTVAVAAVAVAVAFVLAQQTKHDTSKKQPHQCPHCQ